MLVSGHKGELRVGYTTAIEITRWFLTRDSVLGVPTHTVSATVGRFDEFWSIQQPTSIWLHMGAGTWWVWGSIKYEVSRVEKGTTISIRLQGNPEIRVNHREA